MKKLLIYILFVACFYSCSRANQSSEAESDNTQQETGCTQHYEYGIRIDSLRIDTCVVEAGETLGGILNRAGISTNQWTRVLALTRTDHELTRVRENATYYTMYRDSVLAYYIYCPSVRVGRVLHLEDSVYVEEYVKPIDTRPRYAQVGISSSLWNAMAEANLPVALTLELSEIYAWTIDFFGLQKDDSVRVYFDENFIDGTCVSLGRIYAAQFYHGKEWQPAYFVDTIIADGEHVYGYFDGNGASLRKAFLKAPLNYKRISSRFTYARKHPIYKTVRPHTGVDYAAPAGTPVVTIGDGTIVFKAYKGGGGNTVKIRHNSTYETAYLHLSKYATGLHVGQYVHQGEVIGYVGSTGASTGPHLDFRVWKNGTPIDPLKMESPPVEPIPDSFRQAYDSIVVNYQTNLNNPKHYE